jgi:hypothetical protein
VTLLRIPKLLDRVIENPISEGHGDVGAAGWIQ